MRKPFASVLQATAVLCMQERLNLRLNHWQPAMLAGCRNCRADALSMGASREVAFWIRLGAGKCAGSQASPSISRQAADCQCSCAGAFCSKCSFLELCARWLDLSCLQTLRWLLQKYIRSPAGRVSCGAAGFWFLAWARGCGVTLVRSGIWEGGMPLPLPSTSSGLCNEKGVCAHALFMRSQVGEGWFVCVGVGLAYGHRIQLTLKPKST